VLPVGASSVLKRPCPILVRGGVAERFNAAVLKTVVAQVTGGSNPSPSAILRPCCLPSPSVLARKEEGASKAIPDEEGAYNRHVRHREVLRNPGARRRRL
jgi:hypothetical protein